MDSYKSLPGDTLPTLVWRIWGDPSDLDTPLPTGLLDAILLENPVLAELLPPWAIPVGTVIKLPRAGRARVAQPPPVRLAQWS